MKSFRQDTAMGRRSVRFARNMGFNIFGQMMAWAASFFLTPYLVRRLGMESYGLYVLLNITAGYLLLFTFSSGMQTVIKTAECVAARNFRGLREILGVSAAMHFFGVAAGAAALAWAAPACVERFLTVSGPLRELAVWVLRWAALGAVFVALLQFASALMQGLQRFDWQSGFQFLQSALMPAGAALLLSFGLGLHEISIWYAALYASLAVAGIALAFRLLGPMLWEREGEGLDISRFISGAMGFWAVQWAGLVVQQFDKIFIGGTLPLSEITFYAIPAGLLARFQTIPQIMASVMTPMVSELGAQEEAEGLAHLYIKSVRAMLWMVLPLLVILFVLMPQFLGLWLGPEFSLMSVWPARLLVLSQGLVVIAQAPYTFCYSRGRLMPPMISTWAQAALSLLFWPFLVPHLGIFGAALGVLLAQALPLPFFLSSVHARVVRVGWGRYWDEALFAPLTSAALMLAILFPLHSLAGSWIRLLGMGGGGAILYYGSAWMLMGHADRDLIRYFLRLASAPLKRAILSLYGA